MTDETGDAAANRRHWEAVARGDGIAPWEDLGSVPGGVTVVPVAAPAGSWLRPEGAADGVAVLAIHGGGFVSGSVATHARMFGHLARSCGVPVFAVEYGLVPDHVFPSQQKSVARALDWMLGLGIRRIALAGDSCGALLALDTALAVRDDRVRGLFLMSPWTDLEATGASYDRGTDPFFRPDVVRGLAAAYLAGADPHDPVAAPLFADLAGLPPALVQAGGDEALLDDAVTLVARLHEAGVPAELDVAPGQLHTFQMTAGRSAAADAAIGRASAWLRSILSL